MKQFKLLLLLLSITGFVKAQDTSSFGISLNHLALSVKDVDRSAVFYKNILRLTEITNRTKIPGIRWFSLGDGKELHLISIITGEIKITKAVHLGLTSPNFDAFLQQLIANKITYSDWPGTPNTVTIRADGVKQIYFQDPDGYWIEINTAAVQK